MVNKSFITNILSKLQADASPRWVVFHQEAVLLEVTEDNTHSPLIKSIDFLDCELDEPIDIGYFGSMRCFAINLTAKPVNTLPSMRFEHIRTSHEIINNDNLFGVVFKAKQMINWDLNTRFCGRCGNENQMHDMQSAKICMRCQFMTFPQISPAMLVLVWRNDEILLARSRQFKPGIYSILAGFVEPGETLEQTVHREVKEEVGIHIKNLQYVGSQPWPFPSNLMLGFTAEYDHGELVYNPDELEDAQWFKLNNLPKIPKPISLSRIMIDDFLAKSSQSV